MNVRNAFESATQVSTDGTTLQGNGLPSSTIQLKAVQHDSSLTGNGTVASQLSVASGSLGARPFGSGVDGALVFDGAATVVGALGAGVVGSMSLAPVANVYTLTRDIYATDVTINVGVEVRTAGYRVFCTGTLTVNGTLGEKGANGGNGTAGVTGAGGAGGATGWAVSTRFCHPGMAGGNGSAGSAGTSGGASTGTNSTVAPFGAVNAGTSAGANGGLFQGGGGGPNSGAEVGGAVGAPGNNNITSGSWETWDNAIAGQAVLTAATNAGVGGSGAGGRGASNSNSGGGGGGGASSPAVVIAAKTIAGNGTIRARGGNGGDGAVNGGGGGGGSGGPLDITTSSTAPLSVTTDVAGGSYGNGPGGSHGGNGGSGKVYLYNP